MTVIHPSNSLPNALNLNDEVLAAYYQPIIALDTRRITGYEVLGRAVGKESVRSLGPFFGDESIPMEEQLQVDRIIREQAIARLGQEKSPPLLFLNLKPSWIYRFGQLGEMYTLTLLKKYNVDPRRIVIEITEESFDGSIDVLLALVENYRSYGCQIAIDDVGSGFSSADRIAQIQPDLLKIDMHMVKRSATHNGYFGVLRSFSELAEQIGASLLFEGVETTEDLERAIQSGARYVQGFLFAKAEPNLRDPYDFASIIDQELMRHLKQYAMTERYWHNRAEGMAAKLQNIVNSSDSPNESDVWLRQLLPDLDESFMRIYICNEEGIQVSSDYRNDAIEGWTSEEDFKQLNWSWRPYFVPNLVLLNEQRRSIVSRVYTDLDTREWIRTISVLVRKGFILFADIKDSGKRARNR
ncbi:EAL domain-containing protein [Paenibacillus sp. GSMTC-2017]|uniref:EAL domain-containing protein n=1 Tax=Paenibacillus sp. GSMTC-2017 TaxID=2794350 RepID=UPI0018D83046|nr:EAL domain-containing protein [Paenibacillus sp. GSMTC-2017]MBH5320522.1 EAL domain-containing protein [Paenibacillus sp. GSMTC-2017]